MYEALYTPLPDGKAYAARLGLSWPLTPDLDTLDQIVLAHQCTVPFENLCCYDERRVPSLEIPALYRKVVEERRGGFCFELNALLESFLRSAGYDCWSVSVRITRGKDFVPPMLHRGVLVRLDGRLYYCDVGYGGPQPPAPIPLDGRRTVCGETFWGEPVDEHWQSIWRVTSEGTDEKVFEFWTIPQPPVYFAPYAYYSGSSPDSTFTQRRVVNLRTPNGSLALTGNVFTERADGRVTETRLESPEAVSRVLSERFGIAFPAEALRWEA